MSNIGLTNPPTRNLSLAAAEEMLIQHILTERIFRTVFERSNFTRRNNMQWKKLQLFFIDIV